MKVQFVIEDKIENYKEVFNILDVKDRNHFSYVDDTGSLNVIDVYDDGIVINREDNDHNTKVVLRDEAYIEVESQEGTLKFSVKVIAINRNFGNIVIAYSLNESAKEIRINYLGE